ncbi:MAG: CHAT domain-containing protein [Cyanobacteria bacterium P01_H01_bin.121]
MTQEFQLLVTPIGEDDYLIRTERVEPGVPLAEEQVHWPVDQWLQRAQQIFANPLEFVSTPVLSSTDLELLSDGAAPIADIASSPQLVALGQELFNALFQGIIRDSWVMAQGIAQHRQATLRFRLGIKGDRLQRLPWEVLHNGDRPLAARTDIIFSRYQPTFVPITTSPPFPNHPSELPHTLRILMVLAAPTDAANLALKQEALQLQEELQRTRQSDQANSTPDIELTILEQPGREQLTQVLEQGRYQVFHFSGHSNLGRAGGQLHLVDGKTGLSQTLDGNDLAGLLVNNGVWLAVLNSCLGATSATSGATGEANTETVQTFEDDRSLAAALVRRGIPSVLAMAERIPDRVALTLSRLFYRNLRYGHSIDLSLCRARQGLVSAYGSQQFYWTLPVLYLNNDFEGKLVNSGADGQAEIVPALVPDLASLAAQTSGQVPQEALSVADLAVVSAQADPEVAGSSAMSLASNGTAGDRQAELDAAIDATDLNEPEQLERLLQQLSTPQQSNASEDEAALTANPREELLPTLPKARSGSGVENNQAAETAQQPTRAESPHPAYFGPAPALTDWLTAPENLDHQIAQYRQALQANPSDEQSYYQLGIALTQQEHAAEATLAFQRALELRPNWAAAYTGLGQALSQQGQFSDAIRAYKQAIALNPNAAETYRYLQQAIERHQSQQAAQPQQMAIGVEPSAQPTGNQGRNSDTRTQTVTVVPTAQTKTRSQVVPIWAGISVAGFIAGLMGLALGGTVLLQNRSEQLDATTPPTEAPIRVGLTAQEQPELLDDAQTNAVTLYAIQSFRQGKAEAAYEAVEVLLERSALREAKAVLAAAPITTVDDPRLSFLNGRLAWQLIQLGEPDFQISDARRYWETASSAAEVTAEYLNALAFAYYTEGEYGQAQQLWLQVLTAANETDAAPTLSDITRGSVLADVRETPVDANQLTALAGLALVLFQSAAEQPLGNQAQFLSQASQLYQRVTTADAASFRPERLENNWLWTETAIQGWQELSRLSGSTAS